MIITLIAPLLSSCSVTDFPVSSVIVDLDDDGIQPGIIYDLAPSNGDSTVLSLRPHDVVLTVRYTKRCHSRDLIFNIEQNSLLHTQPDSSRVVFHLFSPSGNPLGKGMYGVYELSDTLRRHYRVPEGYVVSVSSPLPESATEGVKSLGLIID